MEPHPAAQHQPGRHQEDRDCERSRRVAPAHAEPDHPLERTGTEPVEAGIETPHHEVALAAMALQRFPQMARQHQETLDQAGENDRHHHQRDGADDLSDDAADDDQREERGDRRQRGRHHRRQHAERTRFRGLARAQPGLALRRRVLADDDRVVDDEAERHDQREQGEHVDALAERQHGRQRGHERGRDPGRHPERGAAVEKHEQHQHHQSQPGDPVVHQDLDPLLYQVPLGVVLLDTELRRIVAARLDQIAVHDLPDLDRIGVRRPLHVQLDRRLAVAQTDGRPLVERLRKGRDVAQIDLLAIVERPDLDISEIARRGLQPDASQLLFHRAFEIARRNIPVAGSDAGGHRRRRQVELAQHARFDLDPDFLVARAEKRHPVDTGGEQLVAHPFCLALQNGFGIRARQHQTDDRVVTYDPADHRPFAVLRQDGDLL